VILTDRSYPPLLHLRVAPARCDMQEGRSCYQRCVRHMTSSGKSWALRILGREVNPHCRFLQVRRRPVGVL
jgi:hypothetical protein